MAIPGYKDVILNSPHPPIVYYRLGEKTGATAVDIAGGHNGAIAGGVTLAQLGALVGDPDTAMLFDGVNGRIVVPTAPSFASLTSIGYSLWVYALSVPAFNITPCDVGYQNNNHLGGRIQIAVSGGVLKPQLVVGTGTANVFTSLPVAPMSIGAWHHIGASNDGAGNSVLYLDGAVNGTSAVAQMVASGNGALGIGSASSGFTNFFPGLIDEVAVAAFYTPQEIANHYNAGLIAMLQAVPAVARIRDGLAMARIRDGVTVARIRDGVTKARIR